MDLLSTPNENKLVVRYFFYNNIKAYKRSYISLQVDPLLRPTNKSY